MKGDHTKFFVSQKYVKNTNHSLICITNTSLFCIPSNIEPSESWSALSLSLLELLLQKSWKSKNVAPHPPVIKTNQLSHTPFNAHRRRTCHERFTSSLALYSARTGNTHVK